MLILFVAIVANYNINYLGNVIKTNDALKYRTLVSARMRQRATCRRCMENVNCLLKSASSLHNQGSLQDALGLYMVRCRRVWQSPIAEDASRQAQNTYLAIWSKGFPIFSPHNAKIAEGFNNLPEECQILSVGLRFINNSTEKTRMYKIGRNLKVKVSSPLRLAFLQIQAEAQK